MATSNRTCLILAPQNAAAIASLKTALSKRGIASFSTYEAGARFSTTHSLKSLIKEADFVCALLPAGRNENLFFELGIALGMAKPALIFIDSQISSPFDIQDLNIVRSLPNTVSSLDAHLDAFLLKLPSLGRSRKTSLDKKASRPKGAHDLSWARTELSAILTEQERLIPADRVTNLVAKVFQDSGASVALAPVKDTGADLALWVPELETSVGNPVVVQVNLSGIKTPKHEVAQTSMERAIVAGQAKAGILLYVSSDRSQPRWSQRLPLILTISLTVLTRRLEDESLWQDFRAKRNELVHRAS